MSGEPTRKRAKGEESGEDLLPKKIASGQLHEAESDQSDVVIILGGHRFPCKKEELSCTSKYFEKMFDSSFAEKNKKEIEIGGIVPSEGFKLFLDVIEGKDILSDESVEQALALADFLESTVLEEKCVEFLSSKSTYSNEEQFVLGDKHNSMKLITRVCSRISNSGELDQIVPMDIDSLRSSTKTIVLQKSFELLGYRKPRVTRSKLIPSWLAADLEKPFKSRERKQERKQKRTKKRSTCSQKRQRRAQKQENRNHGVDEEVPADDQRIQGQE